mmetsp:Transcript_97351/g.275165  ORF Transcript_97351/g.275165 Transcript_97351/m.275165 type:complete len:101 (-) Transcript_97351:345-647(-)
MLFYVLNHTNASSVTSLGNNCKLTRIEFDEISHLTGGNINFYNVVDFYKRIWVANGTSIMSNDVRNFFSCIFLSLNSAKLECFFFITNSMQHVASFSVIY